MKSQTDDQETLSRRGFAKSAGAAFAALLLASVLAQAQTRQTQPPAQTAPTPPQAAREDRNEHDTPPPLLIGNGSVLVETVADFDLVQDSGSDRRHHIRAKTGSNQKIFAAHVKVVDGSGEVLYRYDFDPRDTSNTRYRFQIAATLTNGARLTLNSSSLVDVRRDLVITTGPDRKVIPKCPPATPTCLDKPQHSASGVRGFRHRLARNIASPTFLDDHSIENITITRDVGDVLFSLNVTAHRAGKELRIMIWPEEQP